LKKLFLIFILFSYSFNLCAQKKTKTDDILDKVKTEGTKAAKFIGELFKFQGPTPKNYIPVSRSSFISANQFKSIPVQKNRPPNLELKLLYPRSEFGKGNVNILVGDSKYYKYLDSISEKNIEYIKLTKDGKECIVKKYIVNTKPALKRNIAFLLDHSGSMGDERANVLQRSVTDAIFNNQSINNIYSVIKFDHTSKLIVSSNKFDEINSKLSPGNGLDEFGGGTGIEDGLETAIDHLILDSISNSKIVVLFTDGITNSRRSALSLEQIVNKAIQNNINIITIGYGTLIDEPYLNQIAQLSGGAIYRIYNKNEFQLLFENVLFDLRNLQNIEFSPCMFGDDLTLSVKLKLPDSTITSSTIFKTPLKQGYKIDLNAVFANNSYAIDPIFFSEIDKFAAFMNEEQKVKVLISGHTDKAGDDASNQLLSQRRAESVKSYLIKKGINAQRIKTKGFGETTPAYEYAPNSESNILNRRIEVEIIEN
jgi:hypothetical protein